MISEFLSLDLKVSIKKREEEKEEEEEEEKEEEEKMVSHIKMLSGVHCPLPPSRGGKEGTRAKQNFTKASLKLSESKIHLLNQVHNRKVDQYSVLLRLNSGCSHFSDLYLTFSQCSVRLCRNFTSIRL